ncbi:hypothetical protein ACRTEC_16480 [Janibacter indicus]
MTTARATAEHLMMAVDALGLHAQWVWTGGNCRAIRVQIDPFRCDPHVLITHEWEPFTDGDLRSDLSGQNLALGLYLHEEDDPTTCIERVTDSQRIAAAAGALLKPSRHLTVAPRG